VPIFPIRFCKSLDFIKGSAFRAAGYVSCREKLTAAIFGQGPETPVRPAVTVVSFTVYRA
jgi:hypothetical protein